MASGACPGDRFLDCLERDQQLIRKRLQADNQADGNKRCDQTIFDCGGPGVIRQKADQEFSWASGLFATSLNWNKGRSDHTQVRVMHSATAFGPVSIDDADGSGHFLQDTAAHCIPLRGIAGRD